MKQPHHKLSKILPDVSGALLEVAPQAVKVCRAHINEGTCFSLLKRK